MLIARPFNTFTAEEYIFYIDHHKKYSDFNTLGLYRSLIENENLSPDQKIAVREHAHKIFRKAFDFLQLKDPETFVAIEYLSIELTKADKAMIWKNVIANQQKILSDKRIRHRNFGNYSKHNCGYDNCIYNGLMIKPGSLLAEHRMQFKNDINKYQQKLKAQRRKSERKTEQQMIRKELGD